MSYSAFGVEDDRISKAFMPGAAKFLRPLKSVGPTLKAMPGGIRSAIRNEPGIGFRPKARAVLGVKGVPQTLGAVGGAGAVGGIMALGNGRRG